MRIASSARKRSMPLTRARDRYTSHVDAIHFLMQDGPTEVVCRINLDALSEFGRTIGLSEPTEIFETGRAAIERAASEKYDRTSRRPYEVVTITADDLDLATLSEHQRRILELLNEAGPRGYPQALMLARGFDIELLTSLVRDGFATVATETVGAGRRALEVANVRITDAGRQALEG
jgi:hypothetical protein